MFNNDYFSNHQQPKPNTSYSLFDLVDSNSSSKSCKLLSSNLNTNTKSRTCTTMFDFEDPLKSARFADSEGDLCIDTGYRLGADPFPFNQPIKWPSYKNDSASEMTEEVGFKSSCFSSSSAPPLIPKHRVMVEQAPFSVMKSFKSQETIEKANNVQVISSLRNHPYNNSKSRPVMSDAFSLPGSNGNTNISETITNTNTISSTGDSSVSCSMKKSDSAMTIEIEPEADSPPTSSFVSNNTKAKSMPTSCSRNSSSNAILAHLRSISPNFKSIFVRPKNVKPVGKYTLGEMKENRFLPWSYIK